MTLLIALLGCPNPKDEDPSLTTETGDMLNHFSLVADQVDGGTRLGGWSGPNGLIMVGGGLGSTPDQAAGTVTEWVDGEFVTDEAAAPHTLWWVHGRDTSWWAVGANGMILHDDNGVRVDESVPTESTLFGVWAAEDGRVWAVGGDPRVTGLGEVWLRENGQWQPFAQDLPRVVFKIWDRWIVGDGVSFHLVDDEMVEVPLASDEKLLTVSGRADNDLVAVGGRATPVMMRWDGTAWTEAAIDLACTAQPLNGVYAAPDGTNFVAGASGAMMHVDGDQWDCPIPPITFEHFHAAVPHEDEVWFVGGNLFSTGNNYGTFGMWSATPVE